MFPLLPGASRKPFPLYVKRGGGALPKRAAAKRACEAYRDAFVMLRLYAGRDPHAIVAAWILRRAGRGTR